MVQSYCCGAINVLGWITLSVGTSIVFPQFVNALIIANNPEFEPKAWQTFLMYQAFNLVILLYNIFGLKKSLWIHNVGCEYLLVVPARIYPLKQISCHHYRFILRDPHHVCSTGSSSTNQQICMGKLD